MGIDDALVRNVFFPLWMVKDGLPGMLRGTGSCNGLTRFSREELLTRQKQKLREILIYAFEHTG
jgi:hypothetical protein